MPAPTLYQCIQHSRIVPDVVLNSAFQEAFQKICDELGVKIGGQEEESRSNSSKLDESSAKDDEFDFSDILIDKSPKRGKNRSIEESLSKYLGLPDEQDSMGLDPSDYAQDFPGLNTGFDLYEATFDDPLDVTVRTKMFNDREQERNPQDMFDGLAVDLGARDAAKEDDRNDNSFDINTNLFDLGAEAEEEEEEDDEAAAREFAKLLTPETQEKFDKYLIDSLIEKNAINKWQASQLCCGRSTFTLGNYRIVDLLGQGGYGRVFLARPPHVLSNVGKTGAKTKDDVAIKVLPFKTKMPLKQIGKFLREVEIAKRLKHPNLVRCFDSSKDAAVHYCVSEYVDRGDASRLLKEHIKMNGRLHYRVAAYIIAEAARGLSYMHREGVIHRDIKPGNILLMKTGEVKLADFGMASVIRKFSGGSSFSPLGETIEAWERANELNFYKSKCEAEKEKSQIQGTMDYLPPDQLSLEGIRNPNPLWDIYSLGCSLYYMLTGIVPYPSNGSLQDLRLLLNTSVPPEPLEYDQTIPRDLSRLTMRMMEKNPATRAKYVASADAVIAALNRWIPREMLKNYRLLGVGDDFWSPENLERFFSGSSIGSGSLSGLSDNGSGSSSHSRVASDALGRSSSSYSRSSYASGSPRRSKSDSYRPASETDEAKSAGAFDASAVNTGQNVNKPPVAPRLSTETVKDMEEEIARLERRNAKLIKYVLTPLIGLTIGALVAALAKLLS